MKALTVVAASMVFELAVAGAVFAADKGTKDEAIALTKKAVAFYKSAGADKAFSAINDKNGVFVDRDLYVYVIDSTGRVRAHGGNSRLLGKDLTQLKDADGKPFIANIVDMVKAKKSGWIDYKWVDPVNQQIESKSSYVEPVDDLGFAVGVYK
jgi:signal transduction histidine kinase